MSAPLKRTMTTRALVGALYFMVAGGPFGLEELLAKVGPGLSVLVLLITPLLWSLPTALMVGELGAALPEEGGYVAWVRRALGPFLGFQEAWISLAASVFDMAIYPTIFISYLARFWPIAAVFPWNIAIGVALLAATAFLNVRGSQSVGESSAVLTVFLLLPFVVLSVLLLTEGAPSFSASTHARPSDLLGGIMVAMWNTMGWDNASTVAGEVKDPQRTYPRAVGIALILVTLTYVIPTAAVAWSRVDVSGWTTGAWVDLARERGGPVLSVAVIVGGLICGFGMLNALVLSYSRVPLALAEAGHLPAFFARRTKSTEAPIVAIIASCILWSLSLGLSFERLVSLDILLYGSALMLEFVALVVLRVREPNLTRPYRIPGGTAAALLLGLPPLGLLVVALVQNERETIAGVNALVFAAGIVGLGPVLYFATRGRFGSTERTAH